MNNKDKTDKKEKNRLREYRKALKMTQLEFADKLNTSDGYISRLEGKEFVPASFAERIVEKFPEANYNWLIGLTGKKYDKEIIELIFSGIIKLETNIETCVKDNGEEYKVNALSLYIDKCFLDYLKENENIEESRIKLNFDNSPEDIEEYNKLIERSKKRFKENFRDNKGNFVKYDLFPCDEELRVYPIKDGKAHYEMIRFLEDTKEFIKNS